MGGVDFFQKEESEINKNKLYNFSQILLFVKNLQKFQIIYL